MKPLSEEAPMVWSLRSRYKQCETIVRNHKLNFGHFGGKNKFSLEFF